MEGKKQTVFVGREMEVDREDMPSYVQSRIKRKLFEGTRRS